MTEQIDKTGVTCIWGSRGSGKSTLAKQKIVPQVSGQRIIIIDPMADPLASENGHTRARDFADCLYAGHRRVTLCSGNPQEVLPAIYAAWAHSSKSDPIYAVCDEAPSYFHRSTNGLNKIMFQGRHRGFGMAIIGQRMSAVDAQIRSQASTTFFMRLTDHVDLDTAKKIIGPNAANLPSFTAGQFIRH